MRKIVTGICVSFFSFMFFLTAAHATLITSIWEASIPQQKRCYTSSTSECVLQGVTKVSWLVRFDDEDVGVIDGARVDKNGGTVLASEDWISPTYKWKPIEWIFDDNMLMFYGGIPDTSRNPGIQISKERWWFQDDEEQEAETYFFYPINSSVEMLIANTNSGYPSDKMRTGGVYDFLDPWEFPEVWYQEGRMVVPMYDVSTTFYHGIKELISPIPEPATMFLFGTGLLGLAGLSIRRKKKA